MSKAVDPRNLQIIGEIDDDAYARFTTELAELEGRSNKPVTVELQSGGGCSYTGIAFYNRIRMSPCDIHIVVLGSANSAASLILAAGDKRSIASSAWVLIHDDSGDFSGLSPEIAKSESEHFVDMEDQWAELLARNTTAGASVWRGLSRRTTYLTAEQCLQYGLVDEILNDRR